MNRIYAPIALFTYSRADHSKRAVESLLQNAESAESDLYIFSDGPKTEGKQEAVAENRRYIRTITGFKSIHIIEREKNWGLANSLIAGITDVINQYGKVIVVEDDLILSPYFLKFMNDGLNKYADDERVSSIGAFLNPIDCEAPQTFFLRYFSCWGWATWQRAWKLFNPDAKALLKQLRWKKDDFNINDSCDFYGMLYCHKVGLVDSWAVRFYASCFLAGKLQLFPSKTMSVQSGMDGTGTHSGNSNIYANMHLCMEPISVDDIPILESKEMYNAYSEFYSKGQNKSSMRYKYNRFKSFVRRLLGIDYR